MCSQVLIKTGVLKNFAIATAKNYGGVSFSKLFYIFKFTKKGIQEEVLSREFPKLFTKAFL